MTQKEEKQFFEVVKQDDLTSFCALVEKDEALLTTSFGRFPLLSTLYLFDSKKIVKKFESKLLDVNEFVVLSEPFEIYKKFKEKSVKSLRLYAGKNDLVSPIEMLAVLHQDGKVKKLFGREKNQKKTSEKLQKIYNLNGQKIASESKKIKISAKPKTIKNVKIATSISIPVVVLLACFFVFAFFVGLGTNLFPKHIHSYSELISVSGNNIVAALDGDIVVDGNEIEQLVGVVDGKGHTITIRNGKNLFDKISGTLKNVNIVFDCESLELTESFGVLTAINDGTIEKVKLSFDGQIFFNEADLSFCGFSTKNSGKILNCSAQYNLDITSNVEGDAFFAGFTYENDGVVDGCNVLEGEIDATNADLSGIAVKNNIDSTILNCANNAKICQNVDIKNWSPTVAGIVLINNGMLKNCFNYGDIDASNSIDEASQASVLVGGICAVNYNVIYHCKNDCDIVVSSRKTQMFVGGICAQTIATSQIDAGIEECGALGTISTEKDSDTNSFCGGIVGFLQGAIGKNESLQNVSKGYIISCFTTCEFLQAFDNEVYNFNGLMTGLILGEAFGSRISLYVRMQDDYCLQMDNVPNEIAVVYGGIMYYSPITLDSRFVVNSIEEIKECPVYW